MLSLLSKILPGRRSAAHRASDPGDMRRHRAEVHGLRHSLIERIYRDTDFHRLNGPYKHRSEIERWMDPYSVKFVVVRKDGSSDVSISVRDRGAFVGTVRFGLTSGDILHELPDDAKTRAGLARLMKALREIDVIDAQERLR